MISDVMQFSGFDLSALGKVISKGGNLNIKAVQNHLGLDRKLAERLDGVISLIDIRKASLILNICDKNDLVVTEVPVASDAASNLLHGIHVNYDGVIRLVAPYSALLKTSPRTGHIVYMVYPMSADKTEAVSEQNLVPRVCVDPKYKGRVPFESLVKNRLPIYVGKTSRGLAIRAIEHIASAFKNPQTKFHKALAGGDKSYPMTATFMLLDSYQNEEAAYRSEENEIKKASDLEDVYLLNTMFSRQAFDELQKLDKSFRNVSPEDAEEMLARRSSATAKNWNDPEYAEAVICNNERNFDADDVRTIRMLYKLTRNIDAISSKLGVKASRVKSLISGVTYRRVL